MKKFKLWYLRSNLREKRTRADRGGGSSSLKLLLRYQCCRGEGWSRSPAVRTPHHKGRGVTTSHSAVPALRWLPGGRSQDIHLLIGPHLMGASKKALKTAPLGVSLCTSLILCSRLEVVELLHQKICVWPP